MKERIALAGALVVIAGGLVAGTSWGQADGTDRGAAATRAAVPVTFTAVLAAAGETPRPKGVPKAASGTFTGTLDGATLTWSLTWSHLSGGSTAAHLHQAKPGAAGPVVVALCGPCKSPASGSSLLGKAVVTAIQKGEIYVNVHTKKNANGEIRGQLKRKR